MGSAGGGSTFGRHLMFLVSMVVALIVERATGLLVSSPSFENGSALSESSNASGSSSLHLDDTVRVDPLDDFKKYRGGYDVTNEHYWSSTIFTGVSGYAIAAAWLVCGLGYGGYLLVMRVCRKNRKPKKIVPCHKNCYLQALVVAVVFTILAIVGVGIVLGGNSRFHSRAKTVIDIIIDTADEASTTLQNTTQAMKDMNTTLGNSNESSHQATRFLTRTSRALDTQAANIARQASRNRRLIDRGLNIMYIITTVSISLTLVAVVALLVFGVLKFDRTFQVLIALCWALAALCWLFFGIYLFLQNFANDTCTAFESFQRDPYNNSLSSILPCDELLSAQSVLGDVSSGIYDLVNEVNRNISVSYGNIIQICNPFSPPPSYEYQPLDCPAESIRIGDIPRVLRLLTCPDTNGETCNGGILIPAGDYNRVEAYTTSVQQLLDVYPAMERLVECTTVRDAFAAILQRHCRPLRRAARMAWAALVFLSAAMVGSVLAWAAAGAHHDRGRHSTDGSVKPGLSVESGSPVEWKERVKA